MSLVNHKKTKKKTLAVIGIDEAGRGPLAGPVVVGGVMIVIKNLSEESKIFKNIRDSKKLSAQKRTEWLIFIKNHSQVYHTKAVIYHKVIDKINIYQATLLGAEKVYKKLFSEAQKYNPTKIITRIDGGLKLKNVDFQTIIKGDEKIPTIAAASIVAKTTRDDIMIRLHKKYPQYGFDKHKGYATLFHRKALIRFGLCQVHRRSFTFMRWCHE